MQYLIENTSKVVPLAFAVVGLLLLVIIVIANLFGLALSPEVFDLLKYIIAGSFGGAGAGAIVGAYGQKNLAVTKSALTRLADLTDAYEQSLPVGTLSGAPLANTNRAYQTLVRVKNEIQQQLLS